MSDETEQPENANLAGSESSPEQAGGQNKDQLARKKALADQDLLDLSGRGGQAEDDPELAEGADADLTGDEAAPYLHTGGLKVDEVFGAPERDEIIGSAGDPGTSGEPERGTLDDSGVGISTPIGGAQPDDDEILAVEEGDAGGAPEGDVVIVGAAADDFGGDAPDGGAGPQGDDFVDGQGIDGAQAILIQQNTGIGQEVFTGDDTTGGGDDTTGGGDDTTGGGDDTTGGGDDTTGGGDDTTGGGDDTTGGGDDGAARDR